MRSDIIEKDYHLHRLLKAIANNEHLAESLAFKGGTCIIKAYTGYYRFSEDLDFTWRWKEPLQEKTPSQIRKRCSKEIDRIIGELVPLAKGLGLEFSGDKSDMGQVIIGGGGRMPRFYFGYRSQALDIPAKIKVELNFVDRTLYDFRARELESYVHGLESEKIRLLYRDLWDEYTAPISFACYDPREIYTDKCRASLTRLRYKLRDIIDIHVLGTRFGYTIPDFKGQILEKTRFMGELYAKYQGNIDAKSFPDAGPHSMEELALLMAAPSKELEDGIRSIVGQLRELQPELRRAMQSGFPVKRGGSKR